MLYISLSSEFTSNLLLILYVFIAYGILGFIDDYLIIKRRNNIGLTEIQKLVGQLVIALGFFFIFMKTGHITVFTIHTLGIAIDLKWFYGIFLLFILVASTNAVNLTDGLDGLASGVSAIIMTFFTIIAIKNQDTEMIILGSTVVGSCIGFLIFNSYPAKVFMGDTGSLALGGAVAAIAIMEKMPLYLAIVALIPIIEVLSVVIQVTYFKITHGKRIFKMAPFHHHLELSGIKETKVVLLFWIITILLCVIGVFI